MDITFLSTDETHLTGAIGMMSAPGLRRELMRDLEALRDEHRCTMLVSLVGEQELEYLRIPDLRARAAEHDIEVIRFPIADHSTPDSLDGLVALVAQILQSARSGRTVVIHCWAGLGRTGLVAASCLVALGMGPEEAIAMVRRHRRRAIEDSDQEECVAAFAHAWRTHRPA